MGQLRQIDVQLSEPKFNLASKAYCERLPVVCTGDLLKERDSYLLTKPRNFTLYPDAEL